ncbi:uncharacterized protein LOC107978713 isoform X2 [Cricetulus griseus]|uniref:Uncharacterized protein LOC107978713 isoform X2 n=1 Tax=Cricetulus griseus TaxID=10029 RepID=A0A9J7K1F1_CRIGR|nr:uncharacterized protein LOC107978713 isoform X2 [Cricetulus griseus]XP_035316137.1 uncharacterized protein LOC107978713 isoform X2 [Cricetulus griseus]
MKYCINIFSVSKEDLKAACGISHRSDSQVYSTNQLQLHHRTLSQGRLEEFCVALCGIELTEILSHGIKDTIYFAYQSQFPLPPILPCLPPIPPTHPQPTPQELVGHPWGIIKVRHIFWLSRLQLSVQLWVPVPFLMSYWMKAPGWQTRESSISL